MNRPPVQDVARLLPSGSGDRLQSLVWTDGWHTWTTPFLCPWKLPFFHFPLSLCLARVNTHSDRNSTCAVQRVCKTPRRDSAVCLCFCWGFFYTVQMRILENRVDSLPDRVLKHTHTHMDAHAVFDIRQTGCPPLLMLFVLSMPPQSRHLCRALVSVETRRFLFEELTRPRCAAGPGDAAYLQ